MKYLITFLYLLCFLVHARSLTLLEAKQTVQECLDEFKITKDELSTYRKENSPELDCYLACVMKKRGSLKDGKIDSEKMLEILKQLHVLNSERTEEKFMRCVAAANTQSDECAVSRDMIGCLFYKAS